MGTLSFKKEYRPYSEYKDSDVQWIGKIPASWKQEKISTVFEFSNEKVSDEDFEALSVTYGGIKKQLENAAKSEDGGNRKKVLVGDIVINGRSDRKGAVGSSSYEGSVSLVYHVLHKRSNNSNERYFHYLFRSAIFSEEFYRWGRGIVDDLWTTRASEMKRIQIPVPDSISQSRIAQFLDDEIQRIDQIIQKKQELIKLLQEKRAAIITMAVTKGLNPSVKLENSRVQWIGKIPKGWEVDSVNHYTLANDGGVWGEDDPFERGTIVLRSTEINQDGSWNLNNAVTRDIAVLELARARLRPGDLVVTKSSGSKDHLGKTAIVSEDIAAAGAVYSNFMQRLRLSAKMNPKYFYYLINNDVGRSQINYWGLTTSGLVNLNGSMLGRFVFPIPPILDQKKIVEFLDSKCAKIEYLLTEVKQSIILLKELKSSIISQAVTGKIKI